MSPPFAKGETCRLAPSMQGWLRFIGNQDWKKGGDGIRHALTFHEMAEAGTRRRRCRRLGLRVFLPPAGELLHPAARARRNGHCRRHRQAAVGVHRHLRRHAGRRAAVRLHHFPPAAAALSAAGVRLLHAQSAAVLWRLPGRGLARGRGAGFLHLGQRLQPVRGVGVLELHGRHIQQRAGQAPVRPDRRRRHGRGDCRAFAHGVAGGAHRADESAAGLGAAAGRRGAVRAPARPVV